MYNYYFFNFSTLLYSLSCLVFLNLNYKTLSVKKSFYHCVLSNFYVYQYLNRNRFLHILCHCNDWLNFINNYIQHRFYKIWLQLRSTILLYFRSSFFFFKRGWHERLFLILINFTTRYYYKLLLCWVFNSICVVHSCVLLHRDVCV